MAYTSDILLGRITKISGYEGAVTVKLEKTFTKDIPHLESVFLEIDGRPVPFFISGSEYSGADILKISFEGYESVGKVSEFIGCRIFFTSGGSERPHKDEIRNLTGYVVLDQDDSLIGTIADIIQNPGPWLLSVVSTTKREILIPFHDDFIISIDDNKKIIVLEIPDGLTDIN